MIYFSDAQPPPTKLKVVLTGEAKKKQSGYGGTYTLQSTPINGNPWWTKGVFRKEAIWFDEIKGNWKVGNNGDLGTSICSISGPYNVDEWPNNKFLDAEIHDISTSISITDEFEEMTDDDDDEDDENINKEVFPFPSEWKYYSSEDGWLQAGNDIIIEGKQK